MKTIVRREPKWRKCELCRVQFCVATKGVRSAKAINVRYCPNCGADEKAIQRWILGYPPWPDEWC